MKRLVLLFFASFQIISNYCQNISSLPSIEDVIKEFYSSYTIDNYSSGYITFEKRRDSWFVVSNKLEHNILIPTHKFLFYQQQEGHYEKLSFAPNSFKNEIKISDYIDDYSIRTFNLQPYYGYNGWHKDVIQYLELKKDITEDELNALGRAYSNYAISSLSNLTGDALPREVWDLSLSMNCLSDNQIMEFNRLEGKAQECFKKIAQKNPEYETTVGKIGIKYANEIMVQFHILLAYANNYALKMSLPDNLYSESELEASIRNLTKCPKNSILFSFGDNDFYPVLYLQQKRNLRKDVYLVNYNLIALDRYIYRLTKPQFDAPSIKLSVDSTTYKGKQNEIIYIEDSLCSLTMAELMNVLKQNSSDDKQSIIKTNSIKIVGENKTEMRIPLNKTKYLFKNHWVLLNILDNLKNRKICFQSSFNDQLEGINNYLKQNEGLFFLEN